MKTIFWSSVLLVLLFSCGAPKETGYGHLTEIKKQKLKETNNLPLDYVFFRASDTLCKLYYKVDPKYLLRKKDSIGNLSASFQIQFEIKYKSDFSFNKVVQHLVTDSLSVMDSIQFSAPESLTLDYVLDFSDLNKHTTQKRKHTWARELEVCPEDFLFIEKESRIPLVSQFIYGQEIDILTNLPNETFKVEWSSDYQDPSKSMHEIGTNNLNLEEENIEEDVMTLEAVVRLINACEDEKYFWITTPDADVGSSRQFGASITKVQHDNKPTIEPLIYLVRNNPVTISSWVSFWSEASSEDTQKAQKLINEFNRRVEYANLHFSAHKLGWKTDRGMLYILFGPPDRTTREVRSEIWSYGFKSSVQREFVFQRAWFLSPNDYRLDRNLGYREIELTAIQRWKNGWVRYGLDGNQ